MGVKAIILAAGKGVRMQSELPKVLHTLCGKPLIQHVIDNIRLSGVEEITVVVGYKGDDVIQKIGPTVNYAWQREQLGTGHAVLQAADIFRNYNGKVLIACGDAPLVSSASFGSLIAEMNDPSVKASVLTMVKENPAGYGRMVKDTNGSLVRIVEEKDAAEEQKKIKEVNSGTYVFDASLLLEGLGMLKNDNAQKEYYLPDVLAYMIGKGSRVTTVPLRDPIEGSGINSRDELKALEEAVISRKG
jgi:bifunctional UDP-N-acetylglucosamine pyrophosphorylase/glucosamine-1-phosphate N-acetyltransferase